MSGNQPKRAKRTALEGVRWFWNTRIRSWWTVRLPGLFNKSRLASNTSFAFAQKATPLGDHKSSGITVILTVYSRIEHLPAQVEAMRNQSVPPEEIWVWCNDSEQPLSDVSHLVDRVIVSNSNWKFWGRFAIANLVRTPYICIADDDILPQPDWCRNCLDTFAAGVDGILGGSGVLLPSEGGYSSKVKVGWNGHHYDHVEQVDLVGQIWFFKKQHLHYLWREQPHTWENGEDIHFSYMAQKYGGLGSYVPPHPTSDEQLWSSRPDFGKAVGRSGKPTYKSQGHHNHRGDMVDDYRRNGWKLVAETNRKSDSLAVGSDHQNR